MTFNPTEAETEMFCQYHGCTERATHTVRVAIFPRRGDLRPEDQADAYYCTPHAEAMHANGKEFAPTPLELAS